MLECLLTTGEIYFNLHFALAEFENFPTIHVPLISAVK